MKPKHEQDFDESIEALVRSSALTLINRSDLGAIDEDDFEIQLRDETLRAWQAGNIYPVSEQYMLEIIGRMAQENGLDGWWSKIRDKIVGGVKKVARVVGKVVKVAAPIAVGAAGLVFGGQAVGKVVGDVMGSRGGKTPEQVQQVATTYPVQTMPGYAPTILPQQPYSTAQIGSPQFFDVAKQYAMQILSKNNVNMASPQAQQIMDQRLRQEIEAARMAQTGTLPRNMYAAGSPPPPPQSQLPKWLLPAGAGLVALKLMA